MPRHFPRFCHKLASSQAAAQADSTVGPDIGPRAAIPSGHSRVKGQAALSLLLYAPSLSLALSLSLSLSLLPSLLLLLFTQMVGCLCLCVGRSGRSQPLPPSLPHCISQGFRVGARHKLAWHGRPHIQSKNPCPASPRRQVCMGRQGKTAWHPR